MNEPKVYADLVFIINFIMDYLILWATARLSGLKVSHCRIALAALLGGLYALGYIFPDFKQLYTLPWKIVFSGLLVIIGLWHKNWSEFYRTFLYFYGINFTVAGAAIAFSYFFHTSSSNLSITYLLILGAIISALIIGIYGEKFLVRKVIPGLLKFKVELKFGDFSCNGKGFLDTGNELRDPLTNRPVLIAEYDLL